MIVKLGTAFFAALRIGETKEAIMNLRNCGQTYELMGEMSKRFDEF